MKRIVILCLLLMAGCAQKAKVADMQANLAGEYVTVTVDELEGIDPLGVNPLFIRVEKEKDSYIFTINHKEQVIAIIKKPIDSMEFKGRMDAAESDFIIKRAPKGITCEIMADTSAYHFIVHLEKQ